MAINSKAKGNKFERDISGALSLWLTGGEEHRACWRTDSSGAAATQMFRADIKSRYVKSNAGDIRKVVETGVFPHVDKFFDEHCVEIKHYKEVDFYPPLNSVTKSLFESAYNDRTTSGKKVVLIIKANNRKILWFNEDTIPNKTCHLVVPYKDIEFKGYLFDDVTSTPYVEGESHRSDRLDKRREDTGL